MFNKIETAVKFSLRNRKAVKDKKGYLKGIKDEKLKVLKR